MATGDRAHSLRRRENESRGQERIPNRGRGEGMDSMERDISLRDGTPTYLEKTNPPNKSYFSKPRNGYHRANRR